MAELTLTPGQIDLWLVQPAKIRDPRLLADYPRLLTAEEQAKQQRFRFDKDRHSALITRAFVRTLLSHYADVAPEDWRFSKGHKNKPEIINPPLPLRFNLSHAQGLIVCGVTLTHDIGVDVEYLRRRSATDKLARRYFAPSEVAELECHPAEHRGDRFFDYWTLKESYIKAVGDGLAIPLDDFFFSIRGPEDIRIDFADHRNDHSDHWQCRLLQGSADHRIAISIRAGNQAQVSIRTFESLPLLGFSEVTLPLAASE